MLEKDLIKKFMTELKKIEPHCWYFKSHGEPLQVRGIPDIILCFRGLFVGAEFKIVRKVKMNVTPYQEYTLELIHKAHGFPVIIWYQDKPEKYGVLKQSFPIIEEAVRYFADICIQIKCGNGKILEKEKM